MIIPISNKIMDGLVELIYVQLALIDQADQTTRVDFVIVQFRHCMDHIGLLVNDYSCNCIGERKYTFIQLEKEER